MNTRWSIAQWTEVRWWRNYLRNKPVKPYLRWKKKYWRDFLTKADIALEAKDHILDAGCGPAGIFTILNDHAVTAADPLLQTYENDLPHFKRSWYPNVTFLGVSLEKFTEKARYDKVFCLNVINHVSDLGVSLQHISDALLPGGTLYITVDVHNYRLLKYLFRLVPGDILHPHQHDLLEYRLLIEASGLSVQKELLLKKGGVFNYYLLTIKK